MLSSIIPASGASSNHRQVQCGIFSTIFNPTGERLGNKILRQRLRGPALAAYYPRRVATFKDLQKLYPGFETYNEFEEDRLEHLQIAKSRGKGAPKKKRTAAGKIERKVRGAQEIRHAVLTTHHREQEVQQQEEEMIAHWDSEQAFIARSFGNWCIEAGTVQYGHANTLATSADICNLLGCRSACITYFLLSATLLPMIEPWRILHRLYTYALRVAFSLWPADLSSMCGALTVCAVL